MKHQKKKSLIIFITNWMCLKKYIKLEQKQSWRRRRRRKKLVVPGTIRPKKSRTCITTLWCHVHDHLAKLFIIRQELLVFFCDMAVCCQAMNSLYWVLDNDWELPTIEILRAAHKFSVIVLESLYTRFLSGPPNDPTSIHKSGSKSEWVEGSSPYLSLNRLL